MRSSPDYDWEKSHEDLRTKPIPEVAAINNIPEDVLRKHCKNFKIDNIISWDRSNDAYWKRYMELNPAYFEILFPHMTINEAYEYMKPILKN